MALNRQLSRHTEHHQSPEDAAASAFMSVIVPVHDAPRTTCRCLASLQRYAPQSEVILVDDGSRLAETSAIIQHFSARNGWNVIHHLKPVGHSLACGAGARVATRPCLCLLNSDTVVTPWCWRMVQEVFEADLQVGAAGPSTSFSGNAQALPDANAFSSYLNDNQICAFAKRLLAVCPRPTTVDLPWVSGFAFFIRRQVWEQLGGFDKRLPDYGNEVELCRRLAEGGFRVVWVRSAYIHHFGQQSYMSVLGAGGIRERVRAAGLYLGRKR